MTMTIKPHIIYIGFYPSDLDSMNFSQYRISIIVHTYIADSLDSSIRDQFTGIGVLDVPHNMNLEEYISAMDQIEVLVSELIVKHGQPKAFIALYEHATLPAAILREKFNVRGGSVKTATLCRDKVVMKAHLADQGIPCPPFKAVDSNTTLNEVTAFCQKISGKIVLKPRRQAASEGISIFDHALRSAISRPN